jgi:type III secretion protein V
VASEDPDRSLGSELASQILGIPKAMQVAGLFVLGLSLVPGLPTAPFLLLGAVLLFAARARTQQIHIEAQRAAAEPTRREPAGARRGPIFLPLVVPWSIDVSADLATLLEDETRGTEVVRFGIFGTTQRIRERIFSDIGVPLPAARVRITDALPEGHAVISLFEVPAKVITLAPDAAPAEAIAEVERSSIALLRSRAADFVGIAETQHLLDQLEQVAPALVRQIVPKPVSVSLLADVLRRMVEEQVSIRDLRAILEALSTVAATEKDPLNLTEFVRGQLRRATTYRLTSGRTELSVFLLDAAIEEAIRHAITRTTAGSFLTLAPAAGRDVVAAIRRALSQAPSSVGNVILTQPDIRRFVRKLIEVDLPETNVVSFAELLPEISLRPLAKATLERLPS